MKRAKWILAAGSLLAGLALSSVGTWAAVVELRAASQIEELKVHAINRIEAERRP